MNVYITYTIQKDNGYTNTGVEVNSSCLKRLMALLGSGKQVGA